MTTATAAAVLLMLIADVRTTFCPLRHPFGDTVYFKDSPASSQTSASVSQCATGCAFSNVLSNSNCRCFSYNKTSLNCSLYSSDPSSYQLDTTANTLTYQYSAQPIKSLWQTVSSSQCDFPFEYNGQLYYECRYEAVSPDSVCPSSGYFGCCLPSGEPAFCNPLPANVTTPPSTLAAGFQYTDAQNCSFPYTYNGSLYNSCMRNVNVTNDCHPAACRTVNGTVARCKPPADYAAPLINYTVTVSGQPDQLTLSMFGWISFMRRQIGSKDGNWAIPWVNYVNGFGFSETFLWLGLERVHQLTSNGNWRMRMEYYFNNLWVSAEYWTFTLSSNSTNYAIALTGYSGDDGDQFRAGGTTSLGNSNNMQFSTLDRDHDKQVNGSCASNQGGWWFNYCTNCFFTSSYAAVLCNGATAWCPISEVHMMMKAR